ncbi:COX15/CtaA family protein [Chelatococcus sp. SYSU_G07232]|uniref:Heme A synthase n=1 Tax=Chelatococcus albus TaxID=3047466 RepID=A0ABT7ADN8_9HYPH|nr:COX15/CtaA family protein [Chelatococcus sp. SYSU_G07232]MDJ1156909.1 COX15/CtaA family protein [Chelatococcus sp. SYSU_G07232]
MRLWLYAVALLVLIMVLVGGATRLTGSGLSITEWKPVTGALLPLTESAWLAEFERYRQIPQYELVNKGMTLAEFKTIYLWEWGHRLLGRLIGLAYVVPLMFFVWRGTVRGRLMITLGAIGILGGLQGAIGWIMVASGLEPGMTAVAPVKLMLHLIAACAIFLGLVWVATGLGARSPVDRASAQLRGSASLLLGLVFLQIALGALVAGLDAGLAFNTWPLMDGRLVPATHTLLPLSPWWVNAFETVATVQFNHRAGAYALLAVSFWHAWRAHRLASGSAAAHGAVAIAALVMLQAGIGVLALLLQVPLWAGLLHQGTAIILLGACSMHRRRLAQPLRVSARTVVPAI